MSPTSPGTRLPEDSSWLSVQAGQEENPARETSPLPGLCRVLMDTHPLFSTQRKKVQPDKADFMKGDGGWLKLSELPLPFPYIRRKVKEKGKEEEGEREKE